MLTWILAIVGGLVGLIVLFVVFAIIVGSRYDKAHTVSRTLKLNQAPETVWSVISNHGDEPSWQAHLKSAKRLPDRNGHEVWELQHKGMGNPPMTLETTESISPRRLVRTIADAKKVFSGRWEFELAPDASGARLTITEHGEIPNRFFRGMFHLFANPAMYLEMYLKALAQKFGQPAEFA